MTQAEWIDEHLKQLPEPLLTEALDFILFLEQKETAAGPNSTRQPGSAKGQIWIADNVDAPLDEVSAG